MFVPEVVSYHSVMRLILLCLSALMVLLPARAWADCSNRSSCLCLGRVRAAVVGEVVSAGMTEALLRVERIEGDASVTAVGAEVMINREKRQMGERWVAVLMTDGEVWIPTSKVTGDGRGECLYAPELKLSTDDALELSVATNCDILFEQRAKSQGLPQEECNDTGFLGCGCSGTQAVSMLALLPLLLSRRRR